MKRLGSGTPVGHKPPTKRVTGGVVQPTVRKPITTKPLLVSKPTGGTAPVRTAIPRSSNVAPTGTAGANTGVGRLAQAEYQKSRVRNSKLVR